jgi:hypothetical protein
LENQKYIKAIDDILNVLVKEVNSAKHEEITGLAMTTAMIAEKAFYMTLKLKDGAR